MHRLVFLAILLILALPAVPAQGQTLSVTLEPSSGPPGTVVTIRGSGAMPGAAITIYHYPFFESYGCQVPMDMVAYFSVTADASGRFSASHPAEKTYADQIGMVYGIYPGSGDGIKTVCFRFDLANSRHFPETGHTLSGRFLQYWEDNGGLPTYGYPITDAANETNPDTRQSYLTQWFERNRLELHPENRAPYDVLLGRLGADRLKQIGRDWQAEGREPGPKPDCQWFPETGHNVCNQASFLDIPIGIVGFAHYWQNFGLEFDGQPGKSHAESLALFGLPLTAARIETNSSGDRVLTQWFERARFEWHEEQQVAESRVLLGLLGNEIRTNR